ncbi:MAG TPA: hypothetical protein VHT91_38875 [Kofleriaceae bacterium]|jgi:hypothetical protein|nr:hypothetical protein [Kofleriaceae bacterium]
MARTHQLLTILLLSSSPAGASPTAQHAPPDDAHAPKALIELRGQLISAGRDKVQASAGRFRALCDADGYPLVGNMVGKRGVYQPSEFCGDVRKRENRS